MEDETFQKLTFSPILILNELLTKGIRCCSGRAHNGLFFLGEQNYQPSFMQSAQYKQAGTRGRISGQTKGKDSANLAGPML